MLIFYCYNEYVYAYCVEMADRFNLYYADAFDRLFVIFKSRMDAKPLIFSI